MKKSKLKRVKRCGCWQSESNVKNNCQPYFRLCRKHKFLHALKYTIKEKTIDFWRLRCFFKYDLLRG